MRIKAFTSVVLLSMLVAVDASAQRLDAKTASPSWNDNSLIAIQKHGGDPTRPGDVKIEFYGHDAFKITSPSGLTVLTDPWRNDATGVLPVETVLTRDEVVAILRKYDPRSVIPAHYLLKSLTVDGVGLESADGWVSDQEKAHPTDVQRLDSAELTLSAASLKGAHNRVYYFGNHFEKK